MSRVPRLVDGEEQDKNREVIGGVGERDNERYQLHADVAVRKST